MSDEVLAWLSDWVNALYYSPADATAIPSSFASLKPRIGYFPGARFIMFCLEIRPLNDCNVSRYIMPEWIGRDAERSDGKVNVQLPNVSFHPPPISHMSMTLPKQKRMLIA